MTRPTETVSARFDGETLKTLDEARGRFGDSRGEYMRRTVMSHLHRDESQAVRAELGELRISSARLEAQLATVVTSLKKLTLLLLSADHPMEVDHAQRLVASIFPVQEKE
jgi:hypothetical protein